MKKYLLLILTMLSVSIGTWAAATGTQSGPDATYGYYTFDFSTGSTTYYGWDPAPEYLKILGTPTVDDVKGLIDISWNSSGLKTLDISSLSNFTVTNLQTIMEYNKWYNSLTTIVLPKSLTITESEISTLSSRVSNLQYLVVTTAGEGDTYTAEVKVLRTAYGDPAVTNTEVPNLEILGDANCTSISIVGADDIKGSTDFGTIVSNFTSTYSSKTVTSNANPFNIENGCEVTLRRPADATTMASLLADIKTTLGSTNICKLKITGTLSNADLAALGNAAVAGATRLDLSEATLAAGADITNLKVPTSLTSCLLPVGCTVEGGLLTTFSACSNLEYVISPTNDKNSKTTADYVYVSKPGGLAQAFANESAILHTAKWIKIESNVALNGDDLNIASLSEDNKPSVVDVLDFSGANINPTSTASLQPHGNTYRVILPDNWSADDMAVFYTNPFDSSESNFYTAWGNIAAFYSYSGTALNILGVRESYSPIALCDKRIVRTSPATTAVNFVRGAYKSKADGTTIQYKGMFTASMLKAINNAGAGDSFNYHDNSDVEQSYSGANAGSTITSVTVAPELELPNACTFDNNNLRSINLSGVNNSYADVTTSGCANLQFLLLNNATVKSVTANNSSLESVGLNNVTIVGGDLTFQGAQLTSFTASGTINGNIDLTNNNKLGAIDIVNVDFGSTLLGTSDDTTPSTGDLIILRNSDTDANSAVYSGSEGYTQITGNIKTSTTFGNGTATGDDAGEGRIWPRVTATAQAPFDSNAAGINKNGCAVTINLDKNDTSYDDLAEVLSANNITEVCNLTINTLNNYELDGDDITAINGLTFTAYTETDVTMYRDATLNLDGAKLQGSHLVKSLLSSTIKNVILPRGLDKNVVNATFLAGLTNADFNGAISTNDGHTVLVGYVKKPGQLRTIMSQVPAFRPNVYQYTVTNLRNITLGGTLIAADIATGSVNLAANGNYKENGNSDCYTALYNANSLKTLDISNAIFVNAADNTEIKCDNMTLSGLGWGGITYLLMPTDKRMNTVPANFLRNCQYIPYLCIPYNYQYIKNEAFYLSGMSHITTTDSKGAEIDNGDDTYTFSKNLLEIGEALDTKTATSTVNGSYDYPIGRATPVFGSVTSGLVHDVYILRNGYEAANGSFTPTICYRGCFASGMTYGWGGFDGGNVYCREKYKNGSTLYTVLHYPDQASLPEGYNSDEQYAAMEKAYTDVTKVYTKKDQTGAVDANGDPLPWPTFSELGRSYNQAIRGLVWGDWSELEEHKTKGGEVNGGSISFDASTNPNDVEHVENSTGDGAHWDFTDYVGWHEFVLSKATYVAPDENIVKNNVVYREYEADHWYTFCIPFDMTRKQVIDLLGVPASDDKLKTTTGTFTVNETTGEVSGEENTTALLPNIRTLKQVERTPGTKGIVNLMMSKDLSSTGEYWNINLETPDNSAYTANDAKEATADDKILIRGGYPYIIKPYKVKGTSINNLGQSVLMRYAFPLAQSSIEREDCYESCGGNKTGEMSKFAKPYEGHKIQAFNSTSGYLKHGTTDDKYFYTFIGQYWKQPIPQYSFYMYEGTWYHFTLSGAAADGYYWFPYRCVIMVTAKNSEGNFRDLTTTGDYATVIPEEVGVDDKGHAVFKQTLQITFMNGLDDSFTSTTDANAREYNFLFDDYGIMDFNGNMETTAIDRLDNEVIIPANSKIYNMNGQLVGKSLNGLSKGMYIVNGKKIVIK